MYKFIRYFLFKLDPERAHILSLKLLKLAHQLYLTKLLPKRDMKKPAKVFGLNFMNPVGIAAGFDDNGDYIDALASLGCGFIEIGTVTPKPQAGNKKPRLIRFPKQRALINRMGFNNKGVEHLIQQVKKAKYKGIIGINIGKNLVTDLDRAIDDYRHCLQKVYPYASYVAINISSPNTPQLRQLQYDNYLESLIAELKNQQVKLAKVHDCYVPLIVKVAPDLNDEQITSMSAILTQHKIDGIIAVNTSLSRQGIEHLAQAQEAGGMSGETLFPQALHVVSQFRRCLPDDIPIIACGGISSADDANKMLAAGASLIQVYTGLIYQGPQLIRRIVTGLP